MQNEHPNHIVNRARWRVDGHSATRVITDDDDRIIVAENLSRNDARIIAAAPELFDALNQMMYFHLNNERGVRAMNASSLRDEDAQFMHAMDEARKVIAKAINE